jgi:hypothetical protein
MGRLERACRNGNVLGGRLAGYGIGDRSDDDVDAGPGGKLVVPVHRHEDAATGLSLGDQGADDRFAIRALDLDKRRIADADFHRIARVEFSKRLGDVGGKAGAFAGARHRVPLVTDAAGVERERIVRIGAVADGWLDRDEPRLAVRVVEAALGEETRFCLRRAGRLRPLEGEQCVIAVLIGLGVGTDIEVTAAIVFEG